MHTGAVAHAPGTKESPRVESGAACFGGGAQQQEQREQQEPPPLVMDACSGALLTRGDAQRRFPALQLAADWRLRAPLTAWQHQLRTLIQARAWVHGGQGPCIQPCGSDAACIALRGV